MSSQDSDGESYVSHLIADPKTYGGLSPCGRTTDEEEDAHLMRINDSSSEEEDVPLPQPGDMHKIKGDLCDKILKLESEVDDLKEEIALLNYNMKKLKAQFTSSTTPSSPPPRKEI